MSETQTPQGWRPEEGDVLEGTVFSLDKGWSDYRAEKGNGFYPIVTLKAADGTVTNVHCFHAVLERRMLSLSPAIGDKLKITFLGKQPHKTNPRKSVSNYTVESNRAQDSEGFWGSMGGGNQPPQSPASASRQTQRDTPPVSAADFEQGELPADGDDDIPFD